MDTIVIALRPEIITVILSWYILAKIFRIRHSSENMYRFFIYSCIMSVFLLVNLLSAAEDEQFAFQNFACGFLLNFLYMVLTCSGTFSWFAYEESVLHTNWLDGTRKKLLLAIPLMTFTFLCLCSVRTGWIFEVNENGVYHRGSMWLLQFLFSYFYLFLVIGKTVRHELLHRGEKGKSYRALVYNSGIVLAGCILQILFGHSFVAVSAAIGMVISYIELCATEEYEIMEKKATEKLRAESERQKEELKTALDNFKQADYDRRTDFLTGLRNRQDMFDMLKKTLAGKSREITAMYMMDIDNFKQFNDTYGHTSGDVCLQKIGAALRAYGEEHDVIFFRYGGEEMLGISFGGQENSKRVAEELVKLVSSLGIQREDVPTGVVTISLGYTCNNRRYEKMIDRADSAMYYAKRTGKNRAACAEELL